MISFESHPDNEGVIDQMLSAIYESEVFNHHSNKYALAVVAHYFPDHYQDDEWFADVIGTEEFRDYANSRFNALKRLVPVYEKMYDTYWNARGEWFDIMVSNLNRKNVLERNRSQYLHTMTTSQSWAEFSAAVGEAPHIDHHCGDATTTS